MTERAVHDAIYARLDDQLSVPVYDHVPQSAGFPFVTLDAQEVDNDLDAQTTEAGTHQVFLTVWSDHRGQQQVLGILGEIHAALHDYDATLSSGTLVLMLVREQRSNTDADGLTYTGSVTVEVIAQR